MIVDVGLGNVGAIVNILKYIGVESFRSNDPSDLKSCSKVILPGVGSFDAGVRALTKSGFIGPLKILAQHNEVPLLGICLGMQILLDSSEEGVEKGLGLITGSVCRFNKTDSKMKIPHMGWNYARPKRVCSLTDDKSDSRFYFTHSYHAVCEDHKDVIATTFYGYDFPSIIQKNNIYGVQFHPEKSHRYGMQLLTEFSKIS